MHLLTTVVEAEDHYLRVCAHRKRVNSLYRSLALRVQLSTVREKEGLTFAAASTTTAAGPLFLLSRQQQEQPPEGPWSQTLDLTMRQLTVCQEELECGMKKCARAHIALAQAEAKHAATLLVLVLVLTSVKSRREL